ncbi:MAG: pseudaminic acid synthase [Candidatus Omnitrophica bacterium]|nr:pseudaminic acid synthase [Candidatus Omnitrophota bacterium]
MFKKINKKNSATFVIAEISANHNQDLERAVSLIKKARECGADAVKFQTYTPDTITLNVNNKYFRVKHPKWGNRTLYQLYKTAYTPWHWFARLKKVADRAGIVFFSTAFDKSAVDFLENLNVPFHKIASFELVDLPLIEYAAGTKKPLILSTGMATIPEIKEAFFTAKRAGAKDVVLLKCVSNYPARPDDMNLKEIIKLKKIFKCPIGLSDHSLGTAVALAAVSLGAKVIEKHFTLSKKSKGPDNFFSIEPQELKSLVENIRIVERALGSDARKLTAEEKGSLVFRRSLFAVRDIKKGEIFTEDKIRSIRPAYGLHPKFLKYLLGRKARKDIKKGMPLSKDML